MVYYKLIMNDKRPKNDGLYPIVVRIIHNRTNTTLNTGTRVRKEHWDDCTQLVKKSEPNFQFLNKSISEFYIKVQRAIHKLIDDNGFSIERLKDEISDKPKVIKKQIEFYEFAEDLIKEMIEIKRSGNAIVYQTAVNRLINFCGNKNIKLTDIDYNFLNNFKHKLILDGVKVNTIGNYFRSIRAIYNKAIKAKLVERTSYPFYDISIKQERTAKRAIKAIELKMLVGLEIKVNSPSWHARNYFLLSFALIGISFTDLAYLKPKDIINGRVIFKRRKTHKNYSVKVSNYASSILKLYEGSNQKYLLPILPFKLNEDSIEAKKTITQRLKITNKYLKRLGEECLLENQLTTYVARHSWATTAKRLGYSNELIAEAMGHEYGNKITNIYLDNFDQSLIDELNEKVINSIIINLPDKT